MILTLDLGTNTGYAVYYPQTRRVDSGTASFKNTRFDGGGMRFVRFTSWLERVLEQGVTQVYFEEVRRHLGVDAAHAYGGYMAILQSLCEAHNIPYAGVPVGTIKKHATGKGNASKDDMINAAKASGHEPGDDNEADAICLMYYVLDQKGCQ